MLPNEASPPLGRARSNQGSAKIVGAPSFSIVVPTFERREVVCDVIRALGALRYDGRIEVIVVVDGSTDGTSAAVKAIECPFPLKVVEQANAGAASARNSGAALARNDIILFLDDDMIVQPDLLNEHARLYREGADAAIGDTPVKSDSSIGFLAESVGRWIASTRVRSPLSPFDVFTGQLSVRRSVFDQLGGFDTAFTTGASFGSEDADFGARLLARYDVRHSPSAVSRQVYVVTPREYMERAPRAVAANLRFIRKHPDLARQLFERRGIDRPLTKWLYAPLSRIPFVPKLVAEVAVRLADAALATRFRSNRALARFFSGARSLAYWSALRASGWLPFSKDILVLCYHAIEDQSDDPVLAPYGVPPNLFAEQLDSLSRRGFTFVTPGQLAAFLSSDAPLPRRPVLLTFDDGYADLPRLAREVLQPRGIEALAFIVSGPASGTNEWDQSYGAKTLRLLSADGQREVASLGVEVGSHSRTHLEMPLLDDDERKAETRGSSDDLAANGVPRPRFFAYPYGAVDEGSKKAVHEAGYFAGFGLKQRRLTRACDILDLPRVIVLANDRGWRFRMKTAAPRIVNWYDRGRLRLVHLLDGPGHDGT